MSKYPSTTLDQGKNYHNLVNVQLTMLVCWWMWMEMSNNAKPEDSWIFFSILMYKSKQ